MLVPRSQLFALMLLCLAPWLQALGVRSFQKDWTYHRKEIILSRDALSQEVNPAGENTFLYALCEEGHWKPKKTCDIILETYTAEQLTYKSSCKLNLATDKDSRMIARNFILTQLGSDRAIFMWLDRERADWAAHEIQLRIRVVGWRDCGHVDLRIPIDMQHELVDEIAFNNVVAYEDAFDVFFYSRAACSSGRCKARYDAEGKLLGQVESFLSQVNDPPLSLIFPVSTTSAKGYFVFSWRSGKLISLMVNAGNEARDLAKFYADGYATFGISNAHETYGLCWLPLRGSTSVTCLQMDPQARLKMNVTLDLGYHVMHVKMLNLPEGGFLLLQLVCTDVDCLGHKSFYVSRIHPDGRHNNRPLELTGIDVDINILDRYKINLFEKGNYEYCASFAGPATLSEFDIIVEKPQMMYASKCFNKKYVAS